jgi:DNA-binding transcriptional MerR regulator
MAFESRKLYYKIGEVCEIVGVEPYVLRYWETEFAALRPPKNKAGQRTYRPGDIQLLLQIRKLLYDERYTIAGARKQLARSGRAGREPVEAPGAAPAARAGAQTPAPRPAPAAPPPQPEPRPPETSESLSRVKRELENILTLLDRE